MLPCAILCGGLATRLRPMTQKIPKSMISINGEPFIAHQLRLLRAQGITRVVLCTGFLGEMIENFIGNGSRFGVNISICSDGVRPLGTAGAIRHALPLLGQSFFVLYGDSYLPCDYHSIAAGFARAGAPALMTIYRNDGSYDASNVEVVDGKILSYEKGSKNPALKYIDYGLGVFDRSVFDGTVDSDLAHVYQELLAKNELASFEVTERFYEIGSSPGIKDLETYLIQHA